MRTAVVRVDVDPAGELSRDQLTAGMATLRTLAEQTGVELVDNNLAVMPRGRREAEMLMVGADPEDLQRTAMAMCANAFGTTPKAGTLTYVSHGTDEDAHGVLAGFGLTGDIDRTPGDDGYDIIRVTLRKADMQRIPESRVHTALEASTNCEVHIRTV
jgi:hypothetical protein